MLQRQRWAGGGGPHQPMYHSCAPSSHGHYSLVLSPPHWSFASRSDQEKKFNLPFSGFVHNLDNMTSLHIFEFLEKFGKLIQFGGGGRPLVIQIITLDVLGLFCPSKQMPQNSHPTKLFPFHMGDFVLTFHFICWVILSDFDSSEKLNDVSETRRQL